MVFTGRVADPSLFLAPMIHEFGWDPLDHARIGAGAAIGGVLVLVLPAVFNLVVTYWMFRSSAAFTKVVTTQGNDVPNLVEALTYQRSFFGLLRGLCIACLCLIPVACQIGVFAASAHR